MKNREPVSSEEKLLQIIRQKERDQKEQKVSADQPQTSFIIEPDAASTQIPVMGGASSLGKASLKKPNILSVLNVLMILVFFAAAGYVGYRLRQLSHEQIVLPQVETILSVENQSPRAEKQEDISGRDAAYYQQIIEKRDVFVSPWDNAAWGRPQVQGTGAAEKSVVFDQLSRDYRLVGVVLDDAPQAIFLNSKTKETLFLRRGDRLEGAVLETIAEGRVIFDAGGKKHEMIL